MRDPALHAENLTPSETRWGAPPLVMMLDATLVRVLARAFLAGDFSEEAMVARASKALGRSWRWLPPVVRRFVAQYSGRTRPRFHDAVHFLLRDGAFRRASVKHARQLAIRQWLTEPPLMQPVPAARSWGLPILETALSLADWLGVTVAELEWFSGRSAYGSMVKKPKLRHYHYRILEKGPGLPRLIEAPKPRLKQLQQSILNEILAKIPPHAAAHGFCKGRSIHTFIAAHVAQRVVLKMDLQDFFPSFSGARVQAFFRTLGYPEETASLLSGICTTCTPRDVWAGHSGCNQEQRHDALKLYRSPHLPQGAPTSPALVNACSYRLDCRLSGLAHASGSVYTRYADDLAFSGGEVFMRRAELFSTHVASILLEEGFAVQHRKTRIMRQSVRQQLTGLVINEKANVRRADFDQLKATLTNCVKLGPGSQNRERHPNYRAHLEGRVGFVESVNPEKGRRLRSLLEQINWQ